MRVGGVEDKSIFGRMGSKSGDRNHTETSSKKLSRFDVLKCEQSEGWKNKFFNKFSDLFVRQGISKNHIVSSKLNYPLRPIQEKGRRIPIYIQDKVEIEIEKLLTEGHITKLDKPTGDCFVALNIITAKKR